MRMVEITQYPVIRSNLTVENATNLLTMKIFIDRAERLNINCLVDCPIEVTYCPNDVIDVLLGQHCSLIQKYFNACETIKQMAEIGSHKEPELNIPDFKPIWVIRRSIK